MDRIRTRNNGSRAAKGHSLNAPLRSGRRFGAVALDASADGFFCAFPLARVFVSLCHCEILGVQPQNGRGTADEPIAADQ
jgi:hypothetical protein